MANFNRIAGVYDALKKIVFKDQLENAAQHFLKDISQNSSIIIIGGGSGQLLKCFDNTHKISYVELSFKMIEKAKKVRTNAEVKFINADILNFHSIQHYDYVITPFILDCFKENELHIIFSKIEAINHTATVWIHTDFYPKKIWQKVLVKLMYWFFNLVTGLSTSKLPDFDTIFKKHDFILKSKASFFHSMIESKIYQKIE